MNTLAQAVQYAPNLQFNNSLFRGTAIENFRILPADMFLTVFIPKFIGILLVVGSVSFFFMFLLGAVSWILSGGDKGHIEAARSRITNALVGFVLMISVFALANLIERFFGINILSIDIGPLIIQ